MLIAALADGAGSADCADAGAQLATSLVVDIVAEQLPEGTAPEQMANTLRYVEAHRAELFVPEAQQAAVLQETAQ